VAPISVTVSSSTNEGAPGPSQSGTGDSANRRTRTCLPGASSLAPTTVRDCTTSSPIRWAPSACRPTSPARWTRLHQPALRQRHQQPLHAELHSDAEPAQHARRRHRAPLHAKGAGYRIRQRLLLRAILHERAGQVHHAGLERKSCAGAVRANG
jgi:hypothetical protein